MTHISGRLNAHLIGGLDEQKAIQKTLDELGEPNRVSHGMAQLYSLPPLMSVGGILVLFCVLTVFVLTASAAQTLKTINYFPSAECVVDVSSSASTCIAFGTWLDVEGLRNTLTPQGVNFEQLTPIAWKVTYPEATPFILFSGGQTETLHQEGQELAERSSAPGYVQTRAFIETLLRRNDLTVRLTGSQMPTLEVNGTRLSLDMNSNDYSGEKFYSEVLTFGIFNEMPMPANGLLWVDKETVATQSHTFSIPARKGEVIGIAIRLDESQLNTLLNAGDVSALYVDIAEVEKEGQVTLHLPELGRYTFVISSYILDQAGEALLVRLTGNFDKKDYTVIPPEQIRLGSP